MGSAQQICYVIPCSMRVQALEKAAKVLSWEPQAAFKHLGAGYSPPRKGPGSGAASS